MEPLRIIGISGSAREGSFNVRLLNLAAEMLRERGASVTTWDFRAHPLPLYDQDEEKAQGLPDNVLGLKRAIREADGVLLVCPEYNASLTPLLKNAIDWSSRRSESGERNEFAGKVVALASASPGALGGVRGLAAVRTVLVELGALVISEQVAVGGAMSAFGEDGQLTNERTAGFLASVLDRLLDVAARHRA